MNRRALQALLLIGGGVFNPLAGAADLSELDVAVDAAVRSLWHPEPRLGSRPKPELALKLSATDVRRLLSSLEVRLPQLQDALDAGLVGLNAAGYVELRSPASLTPADRTALGALVGDENADRANLYRRLAADSSGFSETLIRTRFAACWAAEARPGWYIQTQDNGQLVWQKK